ncbi:MAG: hypothetical protein AB9866_27750 [Syntrophobacteraceae bacterium]
MSLGDLIKPLVAKLHEQRVRLPGVDESLWHELFFDLKRTRELPGKPFFIEDLRFDWDGPYPNCRELSEFLHALHWNASVSAHNPGFETITLPPEIESLWLSRYSSLDSHTAAFLDYVVKSAKERFAQSVQPEWF